MIPSAYAKELQYDQMERYIPNFFLHSSSFLFLDLRIACFSTENMYIFSVIKTNQIPI